MAAKAKKPAQKLQAWIDARKRHHLSHAHVQMARELQMNPTKLGKLAAGAPPPGAATTSGTSVTSIVSA